MAISNTVTQIFALKWLIDKMCREMSSNDDVLRTKVLIEINEDFH